MRRPVQALVLAAVLLAGGAAPAHAGSEAPYHCPKDTQSCLDEMAARLKKSGWLGIEYDERTVVSGGYRISRVVPGSPAEGAGMRAGDVLLSVDGARFADNTADQCVTCAKTKDRWIPGQAFDYVVRRGKSDLRVRVTLAALPSDVMAQMIGMHMLEHARPLK